MEFFRYHNGELHCEDLSLTRLAAAVGTPAYVYSATALAHNYRRLAGAFRDVPHTICYSVKANSNLAVLRLLARLGAGFDIVSGGELYRVLRSGGRLDKVVFSGVGKTIAEIDFALRKNILFFNVESATELETLAARAQALGRRVQVAIRVNPDVDPHTHRHISTGLRLHKFGVYWKQALPLCLRATALPAVEFVGIGCHIGSQITRLAPFVQALARLQTLALRLAREGAPIRYLDFGGGLGIRYRKEKIVSLTSYAWRVKAVVQRLGCHLILEPGRLIAGPAGLLLTRVLLEKTSGRRRFVVVDAGMSDFLRPALYGASHRIEPVKQPRRQAPRLLCDVVGPLCETSDSLGRNVPLPVLQAGALLAIRDTGAYGFVLASNYNARGRPPEVLVRGKTFRIIRRRETWPDLLRGEA